MKQIYYGLFVLTLLVCVSCQKTPRWVLTWEENFNAGQLDTTIWSVIPRGGGWATYMAPYEELYQWTDSTIRLMAVRNTRHPEDTAAYLTGGIWSRYKKEFKFGRVEIRAKVKCAQGYWPAIWMCPDPIPYPYGGEIDIMILSIRLPIPIIRLTSNGMTRPNTRRRLSIRRALMSMRWRCIRIVWSISRTGGVPFAIRRLMVARMDNSPSRTIRSIFAWIPNWVAVGSVRSIRSNCQSIWRSIGCGIMSGNRNK